jgi:hypothetical protein
MPRSRTAAKAIHINERFAQDAGVSGGQPLMLSLNGPRLQPVIIACPATPPAESRARRVDRPFDTPLLHHLSAAGVHQFQDWDVW